MGAPAWPPGPYTVDPDDREGMEWNRWIVIAARPHERICFMANFGEKRADEAEAAANLLAASPELYAGLAELLDAVEPELVASASSHSGRDDEDFREEFPEDHERVKRLRALLAKAGGLR